MRSSKKGLKSLAFAAMHTVPQPLSNLKKNPSPAQVLLLTSSADGPMSVTCPCPSTIRSSSCEVPERDIPTTGQDSDWNYKETKDRKRIQDKGMMVLGGVIPLQWCILPFSFLNCEVREIQSHAQDASETS